MLQEAAVGYMLTYPGHTLSPERTREGPFRGLLMLQAPWMAHAAQPRQEESTHLNRNLETDPWLPIRES